MKCGKVGRKIFKNPCKSYDHIDFVLMFSLVEDGQVMRSLCLEFIGVIVYSVDVGGN